MGPQCEDGYTKIANELLEALCQTRIPGESMQIFLVILRKTYGYGKKIDRISLSQFVESTGLKKPNVCRALKQLQAMNVVHADRIVIESDNVSYVTYRINKLYETWDKIEKKHGKTKTLSETIKVFIESDNESLSETITGVIKRDNEPLSKEITNVIESDTHKRKKENKETSTKGRLAICQAWKDFEDMRTKLKKPMTLKAKQLAISKLWVLVKDGYDPIQVLEQSVFNSWQGLFPVKGGAATPPPNTATDQTHSAKTLAEREETLAHYRSIGLNV